MRNYVTNELASSSNRLVTFYLIYSLQLAALINVKLMSAQRRPFCVQELITDN